MKVYKFGGASVKDADGVRNLAEIVDGEAGHLFVIVSAMGKTTNALECVLDSFYAGRTGEALGRLQDVVEYHNGIVAGLGDGSLPESVVRLYAEMEEIVTTSRPVAKSYEAWYDLIVGYGELLSTTIVSEYLNSRGLGNVWVDMRKCFVTNDRHRDANVDIEASSARLLAVVNSSSARLFIGQGFIGATSGGTPTTIGREGSDYSAAVAGYILDAESVVIWKDVQGILNADPKIFPDASHIPELTYLDAIELAHSGAQVIHPKTIKPLQNKNIPLHVRSFVDRTRPGSVIAAAAAAGIGVPIFIIKPRQVLVTIRPRDFSFVLEERFAQIFATLEEYNIKVNLIQSSAVKLSLSVDATRHLDELIARLDGEGCSVAYNTDMELLTIIGYTPAQLAEFGDAPDAYMTQRTRRTLRVVRKAQSMPQDESQCNPQGGGRK